MAPFNFEEINRNRKEARIPIELAKKALGTVLSQPSGTDVDYLERARRELNYSHQGFYYLLQTAFDELQSERIGRGLDALNLVPSPSVWGKLHFLSKIDWYTVRWGPYLLNQDSLNSISVIIKKYYAAKVQPEKLSEPSSPKSPAEKLSRASHWMDSIVREIVAIDCPLHRDVLNVFEKYHPGFKEAYRDKKNSQMANGERINKEAVCRGLVYLYKIRNNNKKISVRAIQTKYKGLGL